MKLVSVIIPTFNREKSITNSIMSVLNQTYPCIECIVVDDCSTDRTEYIVKQIKDMRLRYIKNRSKKGASGARNIGIEAATGEYIAFNDSDDIWVENKLERQVQLMEKNPIYGMCYCRYRLHMEKNTICIPDLIDVSDMEGDIFNTLIRTNLIGTPTMLIKKETLYSIGKFNEELTAIEDHELALRIAGKYKIGYLNEILVEAYLTKGSVNSNQKNVITSLLKMYHVFWNEEEKKHDFENLIINAIYPIQEIEELNSCIKLVYSRGDSQYILFEILKRYVNFRKSNNLKIYLLKSIANNKKLQVMLEKNKIREHVMIYGNGDVGQVLSEVLEVIGYTVLGIIDQRDIQYRNIPSFHIFNLPDKEFDIINSLSEQRCSSSLLQEKLAHKVFSLEMICREN